MLITEKVEPKLLPLCPGVMETPSHPFEDSLFFEAWWATLACKFPIIEHHGQWVKLRKPILKGLYQLKALRLAGWNNYYYQHFTEERFEEFLSTSRKNNWDYMELAWNREYTDPSVFEILKYYGYSPFHVLTMPCPVVDIQFGWDAYWQGKSKNYRRDLTKKLNDVSHLSPNLVFFEGMTGIEEFFDRFFPLHWQYWQQKIGMSYFEDPREQAFIKQWATLLSDAGRLQLTGLEMGGQLVNLCMNVICDNSLYCILTMNTGLYPALHPGLINMHLTIEEACRLGLKKVDIGPGDSHYKKKLSTHLESCLVMLCPNPKSMAGRLYCGWRERQAFRGTQLTPDAESNGSGGH
jgi:hypothetical protein